MSLRVEKKENVLKLNNPELDRRIGGMPIPSLNLIEGANDSGKSILAQQIVYGALKSELKVLYITTEDTGKGIYDNMKSLNWDIIYPYLNGYLKITRLETINLKLDQETARLYLIILVNFIRQNASKYDLVIIDSLTFLISQASSIEIMDFFSKCKEIVDEYERTFVITIHPYALDRDLMSRIRVICDGHLIMEKKTFSNKTALTINVSKIKGAIKNFEDVISFEVSPAYGIKILPFSTTRG